MSNEFLLGIALLWARGHRESKNNGNQYTYSPPMTGQHNQENDQQSGNRIFWWRNLPFLQGNFGIHLSFRWHLYKS